MKNSILESMFRPSGKFVVFLFPCITFFSFIGQCYGQKSPDGVGDPDGASNLSLWLDANKITELTDGTHFYMIELWDGKKPHSAYSIVKR